MPRVDTRALTDAVERLADRLRAAPQSALTRGAAADGLALARELAALAQRLEFGAVSAARRTLPDAGVFAVGDQLAVAGHDLAVALEEAPDAEAEPALAEALRAVEAAPL
ncbi:hypothetical protein MMF93_13570 [Streptomyces tubbatahanensis]|uniref:Uncharacterized protein n=1 Tax=Streptomyces tubbatahanensis TaxID=2923272 RepID=A0ABY3XSI8_9ACTN|nr:hypothetical protein [Streptomyces tubbatahanensis]UNS97411.1 hypothetical protein MMF93_13570 [Streptomyces tubbatahanensis]